MYRHRDNNRGLGFVFGVRSVVLRDNYSENGTSNKYNNSYIQNALHSFKHVEMKLVNKCIKNQKKQIEIRNLFHELPVC